MYELRESIGNSKVIDLPYRCVFAVGTQDGAIIYDTQHLAPIIVVTNLHYSPVTDLTW